MFKLENNNSVVLDKSAPADASYDQVRNRKPIWSLIDSFSSWRICPRMRPATPSPTSITNSKTVLNVPRWYSSCGQYSTYSHLWSTSLLHCVLRVPEYSNVKTKMLYASAKNLLKQSLNGITFVVEGQQLSDLQYEDVSSKIIEYSSPNFYCRSWRDASRSSARNLRRALLLIVANPYYISSTNKIRSLIVFISLK